MLTVTSVSRWLYEKIIGKQFFLWQLSLIHFRESIVEKIVKNSPCLGIPTYMNSKELNRNTSSYTCIRNSCDLCQNSIPLTSVIDYGLHDGFLIFFFQPPFSLSRFGGELFLGLVWGHWWNAAVPRDPIFGIDISYLHHLAPAFVAAGWFCYRHKKIFLLLCNWNIADFQCH